MKTNSLSLWGYGRFLSVFAPDVVVVVDHHRRRLQKQIHRTVGPQPRPVAV